MEKKDKKRIRRDRKDFLEYERRKEACKGINSFATEMLIKGVIKDRRDTFRDIEMFKREGISSSNISLQSEKVSFKEIWWYFTVINFLFCF